MCLCVCLRVLLATLVAKVKEICFCFCCCCLFLLQHLASRYDCDDVRLSSATAVLMIMLTRVTGGGVDNYADSVDSEVMTENVVHIKMTCNIFLSLFLRSLCCYFPHFCLDPNGERRKNIFLTYQGGGKIMITNKVEEL